MQLRWIQKVLAAVAILLALCVTGRAAETAKVIRVGIIGTTTSHVPAFTGAINDPKAEGDLADVEVVAAFMGGVEDNPSSWDRRQKYADVLKEKGCTIYDTIEEMLQHVDAVLLEEVDGRPHLQWAKPVIEAGKPLFIDKPMGGSLADVVEIFRLAKEHDAPCFSSSSLRFASGFQAARSGESSFGQVMGCDAYSPCSLEEHHPDLFWYGVHGVEILFTLMGPGCKTVVRLKDQDVVTGTWADGRIGVFDPRRKDYGAEIITDEGTVKTIKKGDYYRKMLEAVAKCFETGKAPITPAETIDLFAFMEAADESKRQGWGEVKIADVVAKAKKGAARK